MLVKIKKLRPDAFMPAYAHPGDAGLDLQALEDCILQPGERQFFPLGLALEFEHGYVAIVKDKSSLAGKGIHTLGGVCDAGYRGEYRLMLINLGSEPYEIKRGHKIAQLVIFPIVQAELQETTELSTTSRGAGGFGSTGK